ncbi:MAG: hypothetical protein SWH68_14030 [Thermodesulfobacteriota bacterium]|nr:hypothetical protein [Thermodesulfobacteriota bacterium]
MVTTTAENSASHLPRSLFTALIILMPLLMLHWMLPLISDVGPGRSFMRYAMWLQKEMMFAIRGGTFPLFFPTSFGGIQSSLVAGVSQIYLPVPYIASVLPGYWSGNGAEWNLLLLLLTLPAAHLMLFAFLKRLPISPMLAFFFSLITVYAPRLLTAINYGPAIGIWTGHIFLCGVLGLYCLRPRGWKLPLCIIGAVYWIVNSGIPGEALYALFGAALFAFFLPFFLGVLITSQASDFRQIQRFWGLATLYGAAGILLSFAYVLPMYIDVVKTVGFGNQGYEWAASRNDTPAGIIANFFSPLRASFMGLFTGTSLYLPALLIPLLKLARVRIPVVVWGVTGVVVISLLHMLGDLTPVHRFIWEYFPFASATRVPERISLILPMFFLLLLLWMFTTETMVFVTIRGSRRQIAVRSLAGIMALCMYSLYFSFTAIIDTDLSVVARTNLDNIPLWAEPLIIGSGIATLVCVVLHGMGPGRRKRIEVLLCLIAVLQLTVLLRHGAIPFMEKAAHPSLTLEKMTARKQKTMNLIPDYLFVGELFSSSEAIKQVKHYFIEPYLAKLYYQYTCVVDQKDAYKFLNQGRDENEAVIEMCPLGKKEMLAPEGVSPPPTAAVRLVYNSNNRMVFEVDAAMPGVFVFSPVYDLHWQARVNGEKARVYRVNGASHGVFVPKGDNTITFRYWSWAAFWGMLISCLTLLGISVIVGFRCIRHKPAGYMAGTVIVIAAMGLFGLWYKSLYSGENLNTRYEWSSPPADERSNMAYGRQARMSSFNRRHPYVHSSRRAVDGDPSFQSCFVTDVEETPWWMVDMGAVREIGEVAVYMALKGYVYDTMLSYFRDNISLAHASGVLVFKRLPVLFNNPPITIAVSRDKRHWEKMKVETLGAAPCLRINFPEPLAARYIRISASGQCRLALNEVLVYPPAAENE